MDPSIIPRILYQKTCKFYDENDVVVPLLNSKKPVPNFNRPFLIIDTFAKKTTLTEDIVKITEEELKKYKLVTVSKKATWAWFAKQRAKYILESIHMRSKNSQKLKCFPRSSHSLELDRNNARVRICGPNAGRSGTGKWVSIEND